MTTRAYPKRCGKCGQKAMRLATVLYAATIEHDGRSYRVELPDLTVPRCAHCQTISLDEEADFPMPCVVTERDRGTIGSANSAVRAQDQEFLAAHRRWIPPHAGVLAPAEKLARGTIQQHCGRDRQRALWARGFGANVEERCVAGIQNLFEADGHAEFDRSKLWV